MAPRKHDLASKLRRRGTLREAWRHVRRSALSSDSVETKNEAKRFDARWDSEVRLIQRQLKDGRYRFAEALGVPKKRRGKSARPIVVAPVRDRVVQRALLDRVLAEPAVTKAVKTPWSFGGHRQIGVPDAIRHACEELGRGSGYFLTTDIAGFFTSIPRGEALKILGGLLPDQSLKELLDKATTVELANPLFLKDDRKLFPTYELGVAQGCCLSPLLGNVLLADFDEAVGSVDGVRLLRYIDDVLLLGPDRAAVRKAFRIGRAMLRRLGFEFYDPGDRGEKAAEGATKNGFDYLGCHISRGYVAPSADARRRVRERLRLIFTRGRTELCKRSFDSDQSYRGSLLSVLADVSNVIRGWSNQYSFCNARPIMDELDQFVDEELRRYLGTYTDRRQRGDELKRRRMLGVRLFSDGKSAPIYPLSGAA